MTGNIQVGIYNVTMLASLINIIINIEQINIKLE